MVEFGDTVIELAVLPLLQLCDVPPCTPRVTELPWQMVWLPVTVVVR